MSEARELLTKVKDALSAYDPHKFGLGFEMRNFKDEVYQERLVRDFEGTECTTVGCIAGWLVFFQSKGTFLNMTPEEVETRATNILSEDFNMDDIHELFNANYDRTSLFGITSQDAVKAIDNMLEHGEPRWSDIP